MGAVPIPSKQQLAVLDWLRRNPGVRLNKDGDFSRERDGKSSERATIIYCDNPLPDLPEPRPGRTSNEVTPKCGKATMRALIGRCLVEEIEAPDRYGANYIYGLNTVGREALVRWGSRLDGFLPALVTDRASRPIRAGRTLVKRYGGRERAEWSLQWHRLQEADHKRVADRIEESLRIEAEAVAGEQEEWNAMAAARRAERA